MLSDFGMVGHFPTLWCNFSGKMKMFWTNLQHQANSWGGPRGGSRILVRGAQWSFDPRGALSPKFAQNCLKTACFWTHLGGQGGTGPLGFASGARRTSTPHSVVGWGDHWHIYNLFLAVHRKGNFKASRQKNEWWEWVLKLLLSTLLFAKSETVEAISLNCAGFEIVQAFLHVDPLDQLLKTSVLDKSNLPATLWFLVSARWTRENAHNQCFYSSPRWMRASFSWLFRTRSRAVSTAVFRSQVDRSLSLRGIYTFAPCGTSKSPGWHSHTHTYKCTGLSCPKARASPQVEHHTKGSLVRVGAVCHTSKKKNSSINLSAQFKIRFWKNFTNISFSN